MGYQIVESDVFNIIYNNAAAKELPNIYIGCVDENNNICPVDNLNNSDYSDITISGKDVNNHKLDYNIFSLFKGNKKDEYAYKLKYEVDMNETVNYKTFNCYLWNNDEIAYVTDSYITIRQEPLYNLANVIGANGIGLFYSYRKYVLVAVNETNYPCDTQHSNGGIYVPANFEFLINNLVGYDPNTFDYINNGSWPTYTVYNSFGDYLNNLLYYPDTGKIYNYSVDDINEVFLIYSSNSLSYVTNIKNIYDTSNTTVFLCIIHDMSGSVPYTVYKLSLSLSIYKDADGNNRYLYGLIY